MEKALNPARTDRLLRVFKRNLTRFQDTGMAMRVIEDEEFSGESIVLDGERLLNFGLCSYLSLGVDGRVKAGAKKAVDLYGTSYSSSVSYTSIPLYGDLREKMGHIFDAHVVVTGTTTLGHLSALPILVRYGDRVVVDQLTHTSVMTATQGLQVSGIPVETIPHNDLEALAAVLEQDSEANRIWYLTDGVFSMQGDTSPAEALRGLLDAYPRLHLYCDDAHGFAWRGLHGRGQFLDRTDWHERLVVIVGLAKAFGSLGGVIATRDEEAAQTISLCGPALMFGGPIPPPSMGASIASAEILLSDELPHLQSELLERIRLVNRLAGEMGLGLTSTEETPLWFYEVGDLGQMFRLLTAMRDQGFYLNGSGFPVVPHGHAGLRFTVTLDNSLSQIEDMLTCLNEKRLELFGETEFVVDLDESLEKSDNPGSHATKP